MASAQSLACGEPPPAGGKAGRRGPPGGATRSGAGTSTCARTAAGTARHRLKGAGAKAVGRGRPTAPETRDGARQKDVAVRTAGHPTPQRTRRGTARHTAETRQMDDNRRAVKLPRFVLKSWLNLASRTAPAPRECHQPLSRFPAAVPFSSLGPHSSRSHSSLPEKLRCRG